MLIRTVQAFLYLCFLTFPHNPSNNWGIHSYHGMGFFISSC